MIRHIFSRKTLAVASISAVLLSGTAFAQQQQQRPQQPRQQQTEQQMSMQHRQVQGQITDIRSAAVRGANTQNTLVRLRTSQGNHIVVDLGSELGDVNLQRQQQLAARGEIVTLGNRRPILLADQFRYGGQTYDVNRPAYRQMTRPETAGRPGSTGSR